MGGVKRLLEGNQKTIKFTDVISSPSCLSRMNITLESDSEFSKKTMKFAQVAAGGVGLQILQTSSHWNCGVASDA